MRSLTSGDDGEGRSHSREGPSGGRVFLETSAPLSSTCSPPLRLSADTEEPRRSSAGPVCSAPVSSALARSAFGRTLAGSERRAALEAPRARSAPGPSARRRVPRVAGVRPGGRLKKSQGMPVARGREDLSPSSLARRRDTATGAVGAGGFLLWTPSPAEFAACKPQKKDRSSRRKRGQEDQGGLTSGAASGPRRTDGRDRRDSNWSETSTVSCFGTGTPSLMSSGSVRCSSPRRMSSMSDSVPRRLRAGQSRRGSWDVLPREEDRSLLDGSDNATAPGARRERRAPAEETDEAQQQAAKAAESLAGGRLGQSVNRGQGEGDAGEEKREAEEEEEEEEQEEEEVEDEEVTETVDGRDRGVSPFESGCVLDSSSSHRECDKQPVDGDKLCEASVSLEASGSSTGERPRSLPGLDEERREAGGVPQVSPHPRQVVPDPLEEDGRAARCAPGGRREAQQTADATACFDFKSSSSQFTNWAGLGPSRSRHDAPAVRRSESGAFWQAVGAGNLPTGGRAPTKDEEMKQLGRDLAVLLVSSLPLLQDPACSAALRALLKAHPLMAGSSLQVPASALASLSQSLDILLQPQTGNEAATSSSLTSPLASSLASDPWDLATRPCPFAEAAATPGRPVPRESDSDYADLPPMDLSFHGTPALPPAFPAPEAFGQLPSQYASPIQRDLEVRQGDSGPTGADGAGDGAGAASKSARLDPRLWLSRALTHVADLVTDQQISTPQDSLNRSAKTVDKRSVWNTRPCVSVSDPSVSLGVAPVVSDASNSGSHHVRSIAPRRVADNSLFLPSNAQVVFEQAPYRGPPQVPSGDPVYPSCRSSPCQAHGPVSSASWTPDPANATLPVDCAPAPSAAVCHGVSQRLTLPERRSLLAHASSSYGLPAGPEAPVGGRVGTGEAQLIEAPPGVFRAACAPQAFTDVGDGLGVEQREGDRPAYGATQGFQLRQGHHLLERGDQCSGDIWKGAAGPGVRDTETDKRAAERSLRLTLLQPWAVPIPAEAPASLRVLPYEVATAPTPAGLPYGPAHPAGFRCAPGVPFDEPTRTQALREGAVGCMPPQGLPSRQTRQMDSVAVVGPQPPRFCQGDPRVHALPCGSAGIGFVTSGPAGGPVGSGDLPAAGAQALRTREERVKIERSALEAPRERKREDSPTKVAERVRVLELVGQLRRHMGRIAASMSRMRPVSQELCGRAEERGLQASQTPRQDKANEVQAAVAVSRDIAPPQLLDSSTGVSSEPPALHAAEHRRGQQGRFDACVSSDSEQRLAASRRPEEVHADVYRVPPAAFERGRSDVREAGDVCFGEGNSFHPSHHRTVPGASPRPVQEGRSTPSHCLAISTSGSRAPEPFSRGPGGDSWQPQASSCAGRLPEPVQGPHGPDSERQETAERRETVDAREAKAMLRLIPDLYTRHPPALGLLLHDSILPSFFPLHVAEVAAFAALLVQQPPSVAAVLDEVCLSAFLSRAERQAVQSRSCDEAPLRNAGIHRQAERFESRDENREETPENREESDEVHRLWVKEERTSNVFVRSAVDGECGAWETRDGRARERKEAPQFRSRGKNSAATRAAVSEPSEPGAREEPSDCLDTQETAHANSCPTRDASPASGRAYLNAAKRILRSQATQEEFLGEGGNPEKETQQAEQYASRFLSFCSTTLPLSSFCSSNLSTHGDGEAPESLLSVLPSFVTLPSCVESTLASLAPSAPKSQGLLAANLQAGAAASDAQTEPPQDFPLQQVSAQGSSLQDSSEVSETTPCLSNSHASSSFASSSVEPAAAVCMGRAVSSGAELVYGEEAGPSETRGAGVSSSATVETSDVGASWVPGAFHLATATRGRERRATGQAASHEFFSSAPPSQPVSPPFSFQSLRSAHTEAPWSAWATHTSQPPRMEAPEAANPNAESAAGDDAGVREDEVAGGAHRAGSDDLGSGDCGKLTSESRKWEKAQLSSRQRREASRHLHACTRQNSNLGLAPQSRDGESRSVTASDFSSAIHASGLRQPDALRHGTAFSGGASFSQVDSSDLWSLFASKLVPETSIREYVLRLQCFSQISAHEALIALVLISRVIRRHPYLPFGARNAHRLLLTAFMTVTKAHSDRFNTNGLWAKFGGVSVRELNRLEHAFLLLLDHRCLVALDDFCAAFCLVKEVSRTFPATLVRAIAADTRPFGKPAEPLNPAGANRQAGNSPACAGRHERRGESTGERRGESGAEGYHLAFASSSAHSPETGSCPEKIGECGVLCSRCGACAGTGACACSSGAWQEALGGTGGLGVLPNGREVPARPGSEGERFQDALNWRRRLPDHPEGESGASSNASFRQIPGMRGSPVGVNVERRLGEEKPARGGTTSQRIGEASGLTASPQMLLPDFVSSATSEADSGKGGRSVAAANGGTLSQDSTLSRHRGTFHSTAESCREDLRGELRQDAREDSGDASIRRGSSACQESRLRREQLGVCEDLHAACREAVDPQFYRRLLVLRSFPFSFLSAQLKRREAESAGEEEWVLEQNGGTRACDTRGACLSFSYGQCVQSRAGIEGGRERDTFEDRFREVARTLTPDDWMLIKNPLANLLFCPHPAAERL
ncbi:cyclin protein [Toxoplasma gondii ME49]|uniref:Cyclin n=5 Tax=Toxoplasma gondii TaxID=5811 RepID=B6KQK7_TOXGV|nr:cyclin protein [Toxoplasma gondii ME49]ESS29225.1 cyclin protein [Toxoplasma gondii VEG]KFG35820.1 cyclin protein [Toxoplasma gondii p89]PUA86941.1 cyclin protein [Toxoplasma gondii TgCATBr9]EPT32683.1 cyclin protein [Toxoplasma gondii ME49]CEL71411.1 TPA: cyclin [Toxoplasma gondii VEG]|eukprot:XP_002370130.1 cyclin protein [Toxoplasma gondii ME49]